MKFGEMKKKQSVIEITEADLKVKDASVPEVNESQDDLTNESFSLIRNPDGSTGWTIVTVIYNPITTEAKVVELKKVGDSREDAEYAFKVMVGKYFAKVQ